MGRGKSARTYILAQDAESAGGGRVNREEANKDELIFIKGVGYFHPDLLGIKMGDTSGAIGPETGETAPNGEGAGE